MMKMEQEKCIAMIRELLCLPASLENYAKLEGLLLCPLLDKCFTEEYRKRFESIYLSIPHIEALEVFGYHEVDERKKSEHYNALDFLDQCRSLLARVLVIGEILHFSRGLKGYCLWDNPSGVYQYLGSIYSVGETEFHIFKVIINHEELGLDSND